mmetsp:Transcript_19788/g.54539  ORF Transcript_19788/g.54539 Transcript_19788/m.54539 type:complete len:407 (-) Transcript_19788:15-1235(-)
MAGDSGDSDGSASSPGQKEERLDETLGLIGARAMEPQELTVDDAFSKDGDQGHHALVLKGESLQPTAQNIGASNDLPTKLTSANSIEEIDLEASPISLQDGKWRRTSRLRRLYQVWPSANLLCCGGFFITGGSDEYYGPVICVWMSILLPCGPYFAIIFPNLLRRGAYAFPIASLVVFLTTVGLLIATSSTDPGIIPRREVILATKAAADLEAALGYDCLDTRGDPRFLEAVVPSELQAKGYRWCRTCRIIRPPRASHCAVCDNCVLRFDHHCPFVNNCIGQRNYHFFFGFITSTLVLVVLVVPADLVYFSLLAPEVSMPPMTRVSSGLWLVFVLLILGGMVVIFAAMLSLVMWLYHLFLISRGKTTKEFRKSIPNITEDPTFCARRGPMLFDPRALVDPEDMMRL